MLCGAYIELAFNREEQGPLVIEADIELPGTEHAMEVEPWEIHLPATDDDWTAPRYRILPMTIDFTTTDDAEVRVSLWSGEGTFLAERTIIVVRSAVPDYPPES